jgi:DNA-binding PadR family transcriptional regulator
VEGIATQKISVIENSLARTSKKIEEWIVKKALYLIVLRVLKDKSMSGYSIILFVKRKFGIGLSPGSVYSLLQSLEKKGFIKKCNRKGAKRYTLSEKGEATLRAIQRLEYKMRMPKGSISFDAVITSSN